MKKDHRMVSLHVPFYLYDELTKYLDEVRCNRHISDLVGMAIADWLAQARKRSAESLEQRPQGYLWKKVFLPAGTRLRTAALGRTAYAVVHEDQLICDGRALSPSQFANGLGVQNRNAWKHVWVQLPYEKEWKRASELRNPPVP